jgi:hypothetical protein
MILKNQSGTIDDMVYKQDPKLIVMVMTAYGVSATKAKKLIKRYKQKYQYYKCRFCGVYAVIAFTSGNITFYGVDFNKWEGQAMWRDSGGVHGVDDLDSEQDVYVYARICLSCDKLNEVFIDEPRSYKNDIM